MITIIYICILYIYICILLYYTIYTCWILLVFHQIQMPCRLDLSVAISLHFPLAKARAARSTVYWEWVGVRVGFDKVDRPKTKERRGQSLPQCIPSWVGAIRGSPAPGETSVSHNLWWYIYILYTHVRICIDNMSNEFQECQEFHVHAFILWYNFTDLNIDSIAKQSDFWCVFVAIEWTPTEYLCLVDLSGWFSHTDIFLIRLDLEHDPTAIISKQNGLPLQNTARSKLVFLPAPIYSIQNPCYSIMETLSMKACLVSIWMISPILCNGSTDAFTLRTQTVLSIGLANLADPFG